VFGGDSNLKTVAMVLRSVQSSAFRVQALAWCSIENKLKLEL